MNRWSDFLRDSMNQGAILLVEDNADDVELAQLAFERNGISNELVVAWDGAEALDYLFGSGIHSERDIAQLPALMLLDLKLPKMNGLEVLRQVRSNRNTELMPVVILTTSQVEQDVSEGYKSGANSFVVKPLGFEQFSEIIKHLSKYWLELNEPPPMVRA